LAPFIEHTLLKPEATVADIERLCQETLACGFRGACVNSRYIALVKSRLRGSRALAICVVGFPLGAGLTEAKAKEAELAVANGADEIDMVIALGAAKSGDWATVAADVSAVVRAANGRPVKAILETGLLGPDEIVRACQAASEAGAAFVKTATGFLGRGATVEDIELMRRACPPGVRIKASGGIKALADAKRLLQAGAASLGTSSGPALISGAAAPCAGY
jgi:deoxyribose-phosphate aldolase